MKRAGNTVYKYDDDLLRKRARHGEWVNDLEVVFFVSGKKVRLKTAYILPVNARPGPPKEIVDSNLDTSKLILTRDDPMSALNSAGNAGLKVLHLQTDMLESLKAAVETSQGYKSVIIYSDYFTNQHLLTQWIKTKTKTEFTFKPRKDFLGAYKVSILERSATFASDSFDSEYYGWISKKMGLDTPNENKINLMCNFNGSCIYPIGLGSIYAIPGFPDFRTAFLDSEIIQQGAVINVNMSIGDKKLDVQPIDSARIDNKLIASIGDFRHCQILHQEGDPLKDDFLELCLDKIGLLRGARAVGRENLVKLVHLHQACTHNLLPRYPKYWEKPNLYTYLEKVVNSTLKRRMTANLRRMGLDD